MQYVIQASFKKLEGAEIQNPAQCFLKVGKNFIRI